MRPSEDYIYAVSRIRVKETKLLSEKHIEQMLSLPDKDSVLRFLSERGWGSDKIHTSASDDIISTENSKLWELMKELNKDLSDFDFLRIQNDYHNIKASVKAVYTDSEPERFFLGGSVYDPMMLYNHIKKAEYSSLPEEFQSVSEEAHKALLKTGDGQLCDMIIDKVAMNAVYEYGKKNSCLLVKTYCEMYVASANIKIAIRGARLMKSYDFMLGSMCPCDSIDIEKLAKEASKGFDDVVSYLMTTDYRSAVDNIKASLSSFEKWCDNRIIAMSKESKADPFTIAPLVAYILAKQNELRAVGLILTAKENSLDSTLVRERIRDMYV